MPKSIVTKSPKRKTVDKKLAAAAKLVIAELDKDFAQREAERKADEAARNPSDEILFDAEGDLVVIKGLFESIGRYAQDVDTVEFQDESTAILAMAEKGVRECQDALRKIDRARRPKAQKAEAAREVAHG